MDKETTQNAGLRLLKHGRQSVFKIIFSRMGLVLALILLQASILTAMFLLFKNWLPHYYGANVVFIVIIVLYLLNSEMDPSAKITWLVIIVASPVFGGLLLWYTRQEIGHRAVKFRAQQIISQTMKAIEQPADAMAALEREDPSAAAMAKYVAGTACCPVFQNTKVTYFPQGEDKLEALLAELEKAEKYIFMEYFIVSEGDMWGKVLEILVRKAAQGVDVRILYDGTCEFVLLPKGYPKKLNALGIQCKVFAKVMPFVSTHYNYRDHRKIVVIDGHTAFTGGVNLSDEYINIGSRFGHWKDTAVMLKGEGVCSFALMFLQMWNMDGKQPQFEPFLTEPITVEPSEGFVMPYGDCPLDNKRVGQQVYMAMLWRAKRYVHIMTPYLILDTEMENALKYAAERGVEVSLILPGIPDKKIPYALAKSHYKSLLDSGVKIAEYTPGFVHAKVFVCDDVEAVVGTINLDYRSLYHHFECAAYMRGVACIEDIEQDFQNTLKKCRHVTLQTVKKEKWYWKVLGFLLKPLAPML